MTAPTESRPATAKSSSRRALLAGALGGIGAVAAGAVGKVNPVRAGTDGDVVLGASNVATSTTSIENTAPGGVAVAGTGASYGVRGEAPNGYAVYGYSDTNTAIRGIGDSGVGLWGSSTGNMGAYASSGASDHPAVRGWSPGDSTGLLGYSGATHWGLVTGATAKPKTGVYGYANQDAGSRGVWGNSGKGRGVYGQSRNGVGVYAGSTNGYALQGKGRVRFDKVSGVATIAAGTTGVTVSPGVNVTSGSFVLLTPKANLGGRDLWFTTNASADTFRIRMSSSRSSATKIAWLLLG